MFDNHYINIVEKTSGIAPVSLGDSTLPENDEETVNKILNVIKTIRLFQKLNMIKMRL